MAALLQWRKFSFFDVKANVDGGKLCEAIKDDSYITCGCGGRGRIYAGDSQGRIHSLTRHLRLSSFPAHTRPVTSLTALDNAGILVSVADGGDDNEISEVKVWAPDKADESTQGRPPLLRTLRPDPRPSNAPQSKQGGGGVRGPRIPKVTALAVHPNLSLMALGFSDGAIMLYRGDVSRDRGSKPRVLVTLSSVVTSLHLRHSPRATHLFITTRTHTYCVNCTLRDKETTVELDSLGCEPGCATLADGRHEHHFLVATSDAIYSYTSDSRGSCYVFEGDKTAVGWFRGCLVVASAERGALASGNPERTITIYDLTNKLVALSTKVRGLAGVVGEWGGLYLLVSHPSPALIHLAEKDLHTKFQLLFKKNQFDTAISLAKTQCCDQEEVAEILRQYGDWLYSKGNHSAAMDQYLNTVPHLEPSYIIRKYLDTQHINLLTNYLQALHKGGWADSDHTSLLLNCYTRLRDTAKLDQFILQNKAGSVECDVEAGVRVCRAAGYLDHALTLAASHHLHTHHLAILIQDKQDYIAALRYIGTLELEEAKENVLRYGPVLLSQAPEETTDLLVRLCTDYKPSNAPIIKEGSLDGYRTPEEARHVDPKEFEYLVCGQGEHCVAFLERVWAHDGTLSHRLLTALLAEYLHLYSLAPEGQEQTALGEKVLEVLRSSDHQYSRHHALLLCDKHQFHQGKLLLWEQAGMYEEMVEWYGERGETESAVALCTRKSPVLPRLWCTLLRQLAAPTAPSTPDPHHLTTCLTNIQEKQLMPALEVVEVVAGSPHITLGQVREYLLKVVGSHAASLNTETTRTNQYTTNTTTMKGKITHLRNSATQFTATKCNICNNELELPSVHFLCQHSFHQHCFETYSESDSDCYICLPENRKTLEVIKAQETHRSQHDQFHEQLERSSDSFSVLADYLGRGVFTSPDSLHALYPSLNTTREEVSRVTQTGSKTEQDVPDTTTQVNRPSHGTILSVPDTEARLRVLERVNQGPVGVGGEGRLRLGERKGQGILEQEPENRMRYEGRSSATTIQKPPQAEGRVRQEKPSKVLTSPTEGRLRTGNNTPGTTPSTVNKARPAEAPRAVGGNTSGTKFGQSLMDHITPSPPSNTDHRRTHKHSPSETISTALAATHITAASKTQSENPFGEDQVTAAIGNPFGEDFETEQLEQNPFAEDYDDDKNPFAKDSPKRKSPDDSNPFKEDYDKQLNPFGDT
ncbi:hypothetical protein Pmani_016962 [Petrolisthes manimaculis]|uniref:RING-type domain-containing protein n=1 Tax=Petrolisthes manimaculis TaxID=1843537 RepID=A0AAE1PPC2_9EUCA|nr:hypothetical protein Pmani_016962 [Petrolisthes manimaculis]